MTVSSSQTTHDEPGAIHITGTIESHSAAPLCAEKAGLSAKVVSIARTAGGGIAYDVEVTIDDTTWRVQEAEYQKFAADKKAQDDAAREAQLKAEQEKAALDAAANLASVVAAAVAKEMEKK